MIFFLFKASQQQRKPDEDSEDEEQEEEEEEGEEDEEDDGEDDEGEEEEEDWEKKEGEKKEGEKKEEEKEEEEKKEGDRELARHHLAVTFDRAGGSDAAQRTVAFINTFEVSGRAGHFRFFNIFSMIKNDFFCIFYQVKNLFLHQSYLKSPNPSQINLIKNAKKSCKKSFFIVEKIN